LCLLVALGLQANAIAMTQPTIKNDYFNQNNTYGSYSHTQEDEGRFILGNPSVFKNEDGSFVLTSDEWYMIQLFASTASSLPITEDMMRLQFKMSDNQSFDGVYTQLLASYQQIHDSAAAWQDHNGYRDQMVGLAGQLITYSDDVVDTSSFLVQYTEKLVEAAEEGKITGDYSDFEDY
ncbi:hypothetical protein C1141_20875, partial [Vibrio agarivorans]